ncbi:TonB-dependent receptor [Altererythrobacter sp. Z27]|uniref:TonB-dependent receptor n=1 Tax=Altererythrobacter sp. Z27 TaxID=3461147 RepID=UPI0040443406
MSATNFPLSGRMLQALLVGASFVSLSSTAHAQADVSDQTAQDQEEDSSAEDSGIVVTGSRIASSGFNAPTPVTALNDQQLTATAPSTIADALRSLPSLTNTTGPQRNSGTTNGGQSFLNLRSLGSGRTLTLLDGRRFPVSALTGSVDVNLIPSALIKRVEIVTGGASAAYGSDAVAGVVNFILDKEFEGVRLDTHFGITEHGDNEEYKVSGAFGKSFADGRGRFIAAGEYFDTEGVEPINRDWSSQGNFFINGPAGGPTRILSSNVLTVGTYGGMILNGNGGSAAANAAFAGIQFLPDGTMAPYSFGSYRAGSQQIGGDGVNTELYQSIARPLTRHNIFGRVDFELTPDITIYAEGQYGQSETTYVNGANRNQIGNALTIRPDNAFLPQSLRDQMAATGVTSLTFLRHSRDRGLVTTNNKASTYRYVLGLEGEFSGWKWEAYYQHGRSKQDNDILNMMIVSRMTQAVDAILVNGQIVCRNQANGCVPFNPFGENAPSDAALDWTRGTSTSVSTLDLDNVAANISGELFEGWAGPISVALGAEYRREDALVTADPLSQSFSFIFGNPQPWSGDVSVKEGFVEANVPLLTDTPGFEELDFNGAVRLTDYSTSGSIWSWKLGLSWVPFDGLRLRGTRSRDIRAPNVNELFSGGRQFTGTITDPFNGNIVVNGIPVIAGGNPGLVPEVANTLTLGAVIQPAAVTGLSFSIDYYDIKVSDAIATIAPQQLMDQCFAGNNFACSLIIRNGTTITRINQSPVNLDSQRARGVDFELAYRSDVGDLIGPDTQFSLRAIAGYLDKLESQTPGSPPIDRAGEVGISPTPHWSGTTQLRLSSETLGLFLQGRYIGGGAWDITKGPNDVDLQHIPARFYVDAQVSYKLPVLDRGVELFVDVRNLFDKDPPISPANANIAFATNTALYEMIGRNFRVGARVRF